MYCLLYMCIGFNVISLILVILLLDKTKALRMPSQSIDKEVSCPMIGGNLHRNSGHSSSVTVNESWISKMKNDLFLKIRVNLIHFYDINNYVKTRNNINKFIIILYSIFIYFYNVNKIIKIQ